MSANQHYFRFYGESLQPCEPPEWLVAIERDGEERGGDVADIYSRNGVHLYNQFGKELDSIYIYDAGKHGYLIEYWDINQCLATILIEHVNAYLEFRAKYLHAWAWLIKESERIADADHDNKIKHASRGA